MPIFLLVFDFFYRPQIFMDVYITSIFSRDRGWSLSVLTYLARVLVTRRYVDTNIATFISRDRARVLIDVFSGDLINAFR